MQRRSDLDLIKGIAIVAVILYHIGILPYGFLGVDCFLSVSGFLIMPGLYKSIQNRDFNYFRWLSHRLYRIWPITLAASLACLVTGYFVMMPDAYENLAQSVVASNVFANNILLAITTYNYWNTANEFKPLMQMWYLGLVAQIFIILPVLLFFLNKCISCFLKKADILLVSLCIIGVLSLALYLSPEISFSEKFYFPQYRVWEFIAGGIVGISISKTSSIIPKFATVLSIVAICCVFCIGFCPVSQINNETIIGQDTPGPSDNLKITLTITVVFLTAFILFNKLRVNALCCGIIQLGQMSLSLFVWHQVILAFLRVTLLDSFTWQSLTIYLVSVISLGYLSYKTIERISLKSNTVKLVFYLSLILTTAAAYYIYRRAGVVRDIPELGITMDNPYANRNTDYIDLIYKLDKPFKTDKTHVLVIGNSFARDFASILKEYNNNIGDRLEISYSSTGRVDDKRAKGADYVFAFCYKDHLADELTKNLRPDCELYGISTKTFGKDFGIFYTKRNSPEYFRQTIPRNETCDSINKKLEESWGKDNFINLMDVIRHEDGSIPLFTPDNKVISFDCRHLTPDGCRYYADIINFDMIFSKDKE